MKDILDIANQIRKVEMKLEYLSTNTQDEGLAFILDQCVDELHGCGEVIQCEIKNSGLENGSRLNDTSVD